MAQTVFFNSVEEIPDEYTENVWNQRWPDINPRSLDSNGNGSLLINPQSMDRLQNLQDRVGKDRPLIINSGYRDLAYNRGIGSGDGSQHRFGRAFDISMANQDPEEFQRAARESGFTAFGYYGPGNGGPFIHIDDRPSRTPDNPAVWNGTAEDWPYKRIHQIGRQPTPSDEPPVRSSKGDPYQGGQNRPDRSTNPRKIPHTGREGTQRSGSTDPGVGEIKFNPKSYSVDSELGDNPLDGFVDVMPNIRLSMVSQPSSSGRVIETYADYRSLPFVTFASTGEQGSSSARTVVENSTGNFTTTAQNNSVKNLFTIQSLNMKHVTTATASNPELAFTTEFKLSVHEPYGLTFEKEVRKIASNLGYTVAPIRAVWRVDIHWSGYDPDTGDWVRKIPFYNQFSGQTTDTISHFTHLITLEGDVDSAGGSNWSLDMTPVGFAAVWKESISFDALEISVSGEQNLASYLSALEGALNYQVIGSPEEAAAIAVANRSGALTSSSRKGTRYFYTIDTTGLGELIDSPMTHGSFSDVLKAKSLISDDPGEGANVNVGKDITVIELIRAFLDSATELNKEFVQENDVSKTGPRAMYLIRPMVKYSTSEVDHFVNDYQEVEIIYYIEKFNDWRVSINDPALLSDSYRQQRISSMTSTPALRRVYNYAFTPTNTEVKNLDIKVKLLYHETTTDATSNNNPVGSYSVPDTVSELGTELAREKGRRTNSPANGIGFGGTSHPLSGGSRHLRIHKGVDVPPIGESEVMVGDLALNQQYLLDYEQRLFADLVSLNNMEVRGDPRWLLSKSSANVPLGGSLYSAIIRLNIFSPDQDEYMQEVWNPKRPPIDESIGGFYEVVTVETRIESGDFSQSLSGYRIKSM